MRPVLRHAAMVAALLLAPAQAQAGLIGDTVVFDVGSTAGFGWGSGPVVVGPGAEFAFGGYAFDLGAETLTITGSEAFCGFATCSPGSSLSVVVTSLDFDGPITGVGVASSLSGVTPSFTATSVRLAWPEQPTAAGVFMTVTFATAVSEPAALALFGAGLIGLGISRRWRG